MAQFETSQELLNKAFDIVSERSGVIRTDHAYIHEGLAYGIDYELASFANDETRYFMLETPTDSYIHFKNFHAVDCLAVIYENATIDETGATTLNTYNRNRLFSDDSGVTAKLLDLDPTLTSAYPIKRYQGGYPPDTEELVLKQGEKYVIAITNLSGQTGDVFVESLFYEEEKGKD